MPARWPGGRLQIDPGRVVFYAPILGELSFELSDVVSVQPTSSFPIFSSGVVVKTKQHLRSTKSIRFFGWRCQAKVLHEMLRSGFRVQRS